MVETVRVAVECGMRGECVWQESERLKHVITSDIASLPFLLFTLNQIQLCYYVFFISFTITIRKRIGRSKHEHFNPS